MKTTRVKLAKLYMSDPKKYGHYKLRYEELKDELEVKKDGEPNKPDVQISSDKRSKKRR